MDFLKTLMLYMSLTFATSMQAAPIPEATPVPTQVLVVMETAAPAAPEPVITAEVATPTPTAAPVTPVPDPTITPNTGYTNVKQGQRGDRVRTLQERLVELGYLPEGSADGAFGGQTRKAVIAFQEAHGLYADGIAGDATQTHLYENPDVKLGAYKATPTPAPTDTPAPALVALPAAPATAEPVPEIKVEREWLWEARILVNGANEPLACLRQEDGVTVTSAPRVYRLTDGRIQLSLSDLANAMDGWTMVFDGSLISLNASGYVVTAMAIDGLYSCMVDGQSIALAPGDLGIIDGDPCVTIDFLQTALRATPTWDADEQTLLLDLPPKSAN